MSGSEPAKERTKGTGGGSASVKSVASAESAAPRDLGLSLRRPGAGYGWQAVLLVLQMDIVLEQWPWRWLESHENDGGSLLARCLLVAMTWPRWVWPVNQHECSHMKVPVTILTMVGLAIGAPASPAQTNPPAAEVSASGPALAATNGPALAATNGPAQRGMVIPLIIMDEVPLTDAIGNLARQAGLNYLMDPKVGYGQPGPDGKLAPQPSVTLRWENITAEQALCALLNNHNLQLVEDAKSRIARITTKDPAALPPLMTQHRSTALRQPHEHPGQPEGRLDRQSRPCPAGRPHQPVGRHCHRDGL